MQWRVIQQNELILGLARATFKALGVKESMHYMHMYGRLY